MFTLSWIFLCVIMMAMRWWCCFAASSVFVFLSFAYIVVLLLTMILLTLCSLMITMLNFFYMRKLFDFPTILHYWGVKKRIELFVWRICAYIQSFAVIHWRIAKHSWAHNRTHKIGRKNTTKRRLVMTAMMMTTTTNNATQKIRKSFQIKSNKRKWANISVHCHHHWQIGNKIVHHHRCYHHE